MNAITQKLSVLDNKNDKFHKNVNFKNHYHKH